MIRTFLKLFRYAFSPIESKFSATLFIHSHQEENIQKTFWAAVKQIPGDKISIHNKKSSGKIIRDGYPGCIAIKYGSMEILKELMYYYKEIDILLGEFV